MVRRKSKQKYSCSTFMLYLGVNRTYDTPHHQIYASADYEGNLKDISENRITWDDLHSMFRMPVLLTPP